MGPLRHVAIVSHAAGIAKRVNEYPNCWIGVRMSTDLTDLLIDMRGGTRYNRWPNPQR